MKVRQVVRRDDVHDDGAAPERTFARGAFAPVGERYALDADRLRVATRAMHTGNGYRNDAGRSSIFDASRLTPSMPPRNLPRMARKNHPVRDFDRRFIVAVKKEQVGRWQKAAALDNRTASAWARIALDLAAEQRIQKSTEDS